MNSFAAHCRSAALLLLLALSSAPAALAADDVDTNQNIKVVHAFWSDVWTGRKLDRIDALFDESFVIHSAGKAIGPRDKFKAWVGSFFDNIDDLELVVQDIFADGDKVITRWLCKGRFTGEMFGIKGSHSVASEVV